MLGIDDWCSKTLTYSNSINDKEASTLFSLITQAKILDFFDSWIDKIGEKECVFYDSTSTSSYSETINLFDYGYNKDKDGLQTVGVALFVGKTTKMPIYYEMYNGSINDKKQLQKMIGNACALGIKCERFVMDRGYYSKENVEFIHGLGKKYIVCLKLGFLFIRDMIFNNPNMDKDISNYLGNRDIYGKRIKYQDYGDVYLYYSNTRKENDLKKMYSIFQTIDLKLIESSPLSKTEKVFLEDYSDVILDDKNEITGYKVNNDKINKQMSTFGYFSFMSNDTLTPKEVLEEYTIRNCDEQFFGTYKNQLDYYKTNVHNRDTLIGKIFVGFISLAVKVKMDITLKTYKKMYKEAGSKEKAKMINLHNYDNKKLFYLLSAIRGCNISADNLQLLAPLTKKQLQLFELYEICEKDVIDILKLQIVSPLW